MKKTNLKTVTLATALMLLLSLPFAAFAQYEENRGLFGRGGSSADYSYGSGESLMRQGEPNTNGTITNDPFGAPLGSGLAILLAAGAGYAVVRRKRSRKNTMLLLACVTLLGFTQCKKEQPLEPTNDANTTMITLNVDNGGNNGSRVNVSGADVTFTNGDKIFVISDGHYVGTLTHNGTNFSGNITDPVEGKPLYFYFLGNKDTGTLTAGTSGSTSCTVNISDQTNYPHLPVISMGVSINRSTGETVNYASGTTSYEAQLHNKCSLMKFSVTTPSNSPICITGMNNKVIIDFTKATNDAQNNGFTYDKEDGGIIKLKGGSGSPAEKWAIVLPQTELAASSAGSIYAQSGTYTTFTGSRPTIHAIEANRYYHEGDDIITMTVNTATDIIDLGDITANTTIATGKTVIGTLAVNKQISIADGAMVTLSGVNINGSGTWTSGNYAGLNCLGDATIVLSAGTTNTVKGFKNTYPGIHVPSGNTLIIQGTGALNVSSNGDNAAGIGSGFNGSTCGNIVINSGTITATGGQKAAGIGSGFNNSTCGNITINGGTITAIGGQSAAGIGSGFSYSSCGTVTISGGHVNATGGQSAAGIGSGYSYSTCGAISINVGTVVATGGDNGAGIGTGYNSTSGVITISGGTVTATGNGKGAGIGTGFCGTCTDGITIANTVTRVTATKGSGASNSIGAGSSSTCGTVIIGGVVGAITTSPYTYEPGVPLASSSVGYKVCSDGMAYATDKTLPSGVTVIGVVAYKSGSTGIVLYKQDNPDKYTWENRNSGNPSAVNVYVSNLSSTTSKSWTCGESSQYVNCGADGNSASWDALQTRLNNAGCEELSIESGNRVYWTNTCPNDNDGWAFTYSSWTNYNKTNSFKVRPLFAF